MVFRVSSRLLSTIWSNRAKFRLSCSSRLAGSSVSVRRVKSLKSAENRRRLGIARADPVIGLQLLADRDRQDGPQQDVRSLARRLRGGLGCRELAEQGIPLQELSAQLELGHGLLGEAADGFPLRRRELMRLEVDHAELPEGIAVPVDQRHAAVEAQKGGARDGRHVLEARVFRQVGDVEQLVRADRGRADRHLARAFGEVRGQAVFRLEPLAAFFDQADESDRAAGDLSRKLGQRIVGEFGRRIEEPGRARAPPSDRPRSRASPGASGSLHESRL
jgi:hypothetical protein